MEIGDVVQVNNNNASDWNGCLVIVHEIRDWGIVAYMKVPMKGVAYIRLTFDEFDYVGKAAYTLNGEC